MVVHTRVVEPGVVIAALQAGVHAYFLKSGQLDLDFLCDSLVLVARYGAVIIDPRIVERFPELRLEVRQPGRVPPGISELSERELGALSALLKIAGDAEAGDLLSISRNTVGSHVRRAAAKLGADSRLQLGYLLGHYDLIR